MSIINWKEELEAINKIAEEAAEKEIQVMEAEGYQYVVTADNNRIVDRMYDMCGGAYIQFRDKRSSAYKQYEKYLKSLNKYDSSNGLLHYKHTGRQEYRVNVATAAAVAKYVNEKFGDICKVKTYID